jgi:hypothetical protein
MVRSGRRAIWGRSRPPPSGQVCRLAVKDAVEPCFLSLLLHLHRGDPIDGPQHIFHLSGAWRWIYIGTAVAALYLNMFVAVVQAFQKISFLQALAPTQSEYPFLLAQVVVLAALVVLGILAVLRFHPAGASPGSRRA